MTIPSWQPPPVTNCTKCPNKRVSLLYEAAYCEISSNPYEVVKQIKDGLTITCPEYRKQQFEKESKVQP